MVDSFVATHGETQIELVLGFAVEVMLVAAGFALEGFDLERAEGGHAA